IDLLIGLGEAQRRLGEAGSRQTLLDASRLATQQSDTPRLVRAVLANNRGIPSVIGDVDEERLDLIHTALDAVGPEPTGERAELLALQASELVYTGDHERVLGAADEAATIAAHLGDVGIQARVGLRRLLACLVPNRTTAMAAEIPDVMSFADATGDPQLRALSRALSVGALLGTGNLVEARRQGMAAMDIADETGQPGLRSLAHFLGASAIDALGDHEAAAGLTQFGFELGQQAGWPDAAHGFCCQGPAAATVAYPLLLPYRSLHVTWGVGYLGPVEGALAILARQMGDNETAIAHHEAAALTIDNCEAARARALNGYQWA